MSDTTPDVPPADNPDRPDVPDGPAPTPQDQGTTVETGDVSGDVTVAPPPQSQTPEAAPGQPDGDVKPSDTGQTDDQSSQANQDLQSGERESEPRSGGSGGNVDADNSGDTDSADS